MHDYNPNASPNPAPAPSTQPSSLCPLPSALCPLPSALCPLPSALCPLPSALRPQPSALTISDLCFLVHFYRGYNVLNMYLIIFAGHFVKEQLYPLQSSRSSVLVQVAAIPRYCEYQLLCPLVHFGYTFLCLMKYTAETITSNLF